MKRKCIEKKAYGLKSKALEVAKKMYLRQGILTAVYECDICLDFHLTSKRCNTSEYHERWLKEGLTFGKGKIIPTQSYKIRRYVEEEKARVDKIKKKVKNQYREFLLLERKTMIAVGYILPPRSVSIKGTKKENTLPLAIQKERLQALVQDKT